MNAHELILSKQIQWAKNRDIQLIGSKGERGRPTYTPTLEQNLFEPLDDRTIKQFQDGNGNELEGSPEEPAKMQAVHSSSALGVNIFKYWQKRELTSDIAATCGFCEKGNRITDSIDFERKLPIKTKFVVPPNLDVVFNPKDKEKGKLFAVECKFTEAYSTQKHGGLKDKYLEEQDLWQDLPSLHSLAKKINPEDHEFTYLHSAQLIKHILGLKTAVKKDGFKLLYLWYDALGKDGAKHQDEIEMFTEYARKDSVFFISKSYQELIVSLANDYRQTHPAYIQYITERYF